MKKNNVLTSFQFGYMINPGLYVNKAFREKVINCMYTTFVAITQPFIKSTLEKNKTRVLALLMFMRKEQKILLLECLVVLFIP